MAQQKIILGDGSRLEPEGICRFGKGSAAVMKLVKSEITFSGHRLYGMAICGDDHAAWASNCSKATEADVRRWASTKSDRHYRQINN